jgi:hypothetical protein
MVFNLLFPLWMVLSLPLTFGAANDAELKRIKQLDTLFAVRVQIWMLLVRFILGLRVVIVDGVRSPAEQAALHAQDKRNPLSPGDHGSGHAVDVNLYNSAGALVLRKASPATAWAPVYELAKLCGLSNGSTFTGYPDNNHFYKRS